MPLVNDEILSYLEQSGGHRPGPALRRAGAGTVRHRRVPGRPPRPRGARAVGVDAVVVGQPGGRRPRARHRPPPRPHVRAARRAGHRLHGDLPELHPRLRRDRRQRAAGPRLPGREPLHRPALRRLPGPVRPCRRHPHGHPGDGGGRDHLRGRRAGPHARSCSPGTPRRPVPAGGFRMDVFGLDSAHDYDPVWATCVAKGVAPAFHSSVQYTHTARSVSSYVFNHVGGIAGAHTMLCKALVPRRRLPPLPRAAHRLPRGRGGLGGEPARRPEGPLGQAGRPRHRGPGPRPARRRRRAGPRRPLRRRPDAGRARPHRRVPVAATRAGPSSSTSSRLPA